MSVLLSLALFFALSFTAVGPFSVRKIHVRGTLSLANRQLRTHGRPHWFTMNGEFAIVLAIRHRCWEELTKECLGHNGLRSALENCERQYTLSVTDSVLAWATPENRVK